MELLRQVTNTQFLFPAAAVAVVLICAALVFMFGFHSAEQPQFDKLPLIVDDRKSSNKKRKTKDKKSSPNRNATEDAKTKSEVSKKSPTKEKKEEKAKESEKPVVVKPKEKVVETKVKKDTMIDAKKGKKTKSGAEVEKPADFDDGEWKEVPKKSEKKKVKSPEDKVEKKDSPGKKNKKKVKDADLEAAHPVETLTEVEEDVVKVLSSSGPLVDEEEKRVLQAQVEELQRVLKEAEMRDKAALGHTDDEDSPGTEDMSDVKDLRSNKRKENMEKQKKQKANEAAASAKSVPKDAIEKDSDSSDKQEANSNAPVFDELGDTWSEAKTLKKSKKKARKD